MKKLTSALILAAVLIPLNAFALKIGYIDMQRAINEVEEGKKAKKKLRRIFKARQKELQEKQEELEKMKSTLQKEVALLKEDVKKKKLLEYQKKVMELQQFVYKNQKELAEKESEMLKPIMERMQKLLADIAKKGKYSLIMERRAILYLPKSADLTDKLIKRYNAGK